MLTPFIILPIAGLIAVEETPSTVRLALLGILMATLCYDVSRSVPRKHPVSISGGLVALALFQFLQSAAWTNSLLNAPAGIEVSRVLFVVIAVFPWAILWLYCCREGYALTLSPLPPVALGLISWGCLAVALSVAGLSGTATVAIYGQEQVGSIGRTRTVLPGFWGTVSGGVFCGLAASASIAGIMSARTVFQKGFYILSGFTALYGVYLTDTRSAYAVVGASVLVGLLAKHSYNNGTASLGQRRLLQFIVVACFMFPFGAPVLLPSIDATTEHANVPFVDLIPTRSIHENPFSFGGRTRVWEVATDVAWSEPAYLFAAHAAGEFQFGVSEAIFATGCIPGTMESAHSHNAILNTYFSFGLAGLIAVAILLYYIYAWLKATGTCSAHITNIVLFTGLAIFMAFESLFSLTYLYCSLVLVLLSADLCSAANRNRSDQAANLVL